MLRTTMPHNLFNSLQTFAPTQGKTGQFYSLPQLEKEDIAQTSKLPISIRVVLESVLRNYDGEKITEDDVRAIAGWQPHAERTEEVPFTVARVLLQDFTGVPLLVDLAAMRSAVTRLNKNPGIIEPLVPVDLVIDHSVQVDFSSSNDAFRKNMEMEFRRNNSRYQFLKWGMQAFDGFRVIPPGIGICHQVNLEYLAKCVWGKHGMYYPDSLVGTDSHTTMINGLGVVGWGVGGIEAEAAMLGQPTVMLIPEVVGVRLDGRLAPGATATDVVLTVTEMLRRRGVVGKFVEFYGPGVAGLALADRATIGNMAPEYGATIGFFPIDAETLTYLRLSGRDPALIALVEAYARAQGLFRTADTPDPVFSDRLELDLGTVQPSLAGPRRPQDRVPLRAGRGAWRKALAEFLKKEVDGLDRKEVERWLAEGGQPIAPAPPAPKTLGDLAKTVPIEMGGERGQLGHGAVVIAAITSCTDTSNPSVLLAAGLLARKAVARGLRLRPRGKTSLP